MVVSFLKFKEELVVGLIIATIILFAYQCVIYSIYP